MAGKPITRKYISRVAEYGISNVLDRVATGATMDTIAADVGVSRVFLSMYLNRQVPVELVFARALGEYQRVTKRPRFKEQTEEHLRIKQQLEYFRRMAQGAEPTAGADAGLTREQIVAVHAEAARRLRAGGPARETN